MQADAALQPGVEPRRRDRPRNEIVASVVHAVFHVERGAADIGDARQEPGAGALLVGQRHDEMAVPHGLKIWRVVGIRLELNVASGNTSAASRDQPPR